MFILDDCMTLFQLAANVLPAGELTKKVKCNSCAASSNLKCNSPVQQLLLYNKAYMMVTVASGWVTIMVSMVRVLWHLPTKVLFHMVTSNDRNMVKNKYCWKVQKGDLSNKIGAGIFRVQLCATQMLHISSWTDIIIYEYLSCYFCIQISYKWKPLAYYHGNYEKFQDIKAIVMDWIQIYTIS